MLSYHRPLRVVHPTHICRCQRAGYTLDIRQRAEQTLRLQPGLGNWPTSSISPSPASLCHHLLLAHVTAPHLSPARAGATYPLRSAPRWALVPPPPRPGFARGLGEEGPARAGAGGAQQLQVANGSPRPGPAPRAGWRRRPLVGLRARAAGRRGAGAGSWAAARVRARARGRRGGMGRLGARRLVLLAACLGLCGALGGTRPTSLSRPLPGRAAPASAGWGPSRDSRRPREAARRPLLELRGRTFLGWAAGRRLFGPARGCGRRRGKLPATPTPTPHTRARPAPPVPGSPGEARGEGPGWGSLPSFAGPSLPSGGFGAGLRGALPAERTNPAALPSEPVQLCAWPGPVGGAWLRGPAGLWGLKLVPKFFGCWPGLLF